MYATKIPSDERSLVLRLIEGEEDAFCELYAAYKNRLIYFAMRFLKSREYAEDIFQDAYNSVAGTPFHQSGCFIFRLSVYNRAKPYTESATRFVLSR